MNANDMAKKLYSLGKKDWMCNHQDNELLMAAARKIWELMALVDQQRTTIGDLMKRLEASEDREPDSDPEWPPIDADDEGGDLGVDEIRFR